VLKKTTAFKKFLDLADIYGAMEEKAIVAKSINRGRTLKVKRITNF
jgi:hypothetical protein